MLLPFGPLTTSKPTEGGGPVDAPLGHPGGFPAPSQSNAVDDLVEPTVTTWDLTKVGDDAQAADVRAAADCLARRLADGELVRRLARDGFQGPGFDLFATELVRYARSVLKAWLATGHINVLLRQKGIGKEVSEDERSSLTRPGGLLDDLTEMTVARAIKKFRSGPLPAAGWTEEGGAGLQTYFMGGCLYAFADELEIHRTQQRRWSPNLSVEDPSQYERRSAVRDVDPASHVAHLSAVETLIADWSDREKRIVCLAADGYAQDEIAEILGEPSVRAIEGVLFRLRKRLSSTTQERR